jgi:uncharacterized protein YlxW (UPF0749 family)
MQKRSGVLAVTSVLAILGFLVVVQLRVQAQSPGLAALNAQELTVLIGNLSTRNAQLEAEVAVLERQERQLAAGEDLGQTSLGQIRADLDRVRAFTGLMAVTGPGVRVTVDGPLSPDGLTALLNELRNAGAEATAVDGVRIAPGIGVAGTAGALVLDERPLGSTFEIHAIGLPETITGSLTRIGGPIAQLAVRYPDVLIEVTAAERLDVPASERAPGFVHAKPRI